MHTECISAASNLSLIKLNNSCRYLTTLHWATQQQSTGSFIIKVETKSKKLSLFHSLIILLWIDCRLQCVFSQLAFNDMAWVLKCIHSFLRICIKVVTGTDCIWSESNSPLPLNTIQLPWHISQDTAFHRTILCLNIYSCPILHWQRGDKAHNLTAMAPTNATN